MTQDEIIRMARDAGSIDSEDVILTVYAAFAANEREKQAEQEPVIGAYEVVNEKGDEWSLVYPAAVHRYKSIPEERITQTFYAATVRTKDLTDDEIMKINVDTAGIVPTCNRQFHFARAVIAADRELNK